MWILPGRSYRGESRRLLNPSNADRPCTRILINAAILPSSVCCPQPIALRDGGIMQEDRSKWYFIKLEVEEQRRYIYLLFRNFGEKCLSEE